MERVLERLAALDPGALPLLGKLVPLWAGILLAVAGLALLVAGSRRPLRPVVAGLAGAVAGYFLVPPATRTLGIGFSHSGWIGAGAFGLLGALHGQTLAAVAGGIGGALLALSFWPGQLLRAALPGLVVGGLVAALFHRALLSLAAAGFGAGAVAVGATSILLRTSIAGDVTAYPVVPLAAAGILFICAAAYQLTRPGDGRKPAMAMPGPKRRAG